MQGNARLARSDLAEEIGRLRAEPADGDIGGTTLAAQAAALDLIDEYRVWTPVLVGGGIPFCPREARHVELELVGSRTSRSKVVQLRYRVRR